VNARSREPSALASFLFFSWKTFVPKALEARIGEGSKEPLRISEHDGYNCPNIYFRASAGFISWLQLTSFGWEDAAQ
jgi:hypothetical protein